MVRIAAVAFFPAENIETAPQISVGRCVSTIYNYLIVMVVIMLSFAVGVNLLVTPYLNSVVVNEDGSEQWMGPHFQKFFHFLAISFCNRSDMQFILACSLRSETSFGLSSDTLILVFIR